MSIISIPFTFSVGAVIVAAQHNSNFSVIYNDYNGNITDPNISPSAAIEYSKLSLNNSIKSTDILSTTIISPSNISGLTYTNITQFPYIKCTNTQTSGTAGGSTTSGSWQTMILNTKDNDTSSIGTLTSNILSLPSGTYLVKASAPLFGGSSGSGGQLRLFNNTASSILVNGQDSNSASSANVGVTCILSGQFTLSSTSNIILQYQVGTSQSSNGLGVALSFGVEVYAMIEFTKVA